MFLVFFNVFFLLFEQTLFASCFFLIFKVLNFLNILMFGAFYGPLATTIVLVAKNRVDRSVSELWKFKKV